MIIATYRTRRGTTVLIADDYMVAKGSQEEQKIVAEQRQTAHNILNAWANKQGDRKDGTDKSA